MRAKLVLPLVAALALVGCAVEEVEPTTPVPAPIATDEDSPVAEETGATSTESAAPDPCPSPDATPEADPEPIEQAGPPVEEFQTTEHGVFNEPWAMEFLPGSDYLLISERTGQLQLRNQETGEVTQVSGTPGVKTGGQGGMHDVLAAPSFEEDGGVYVSWVRGADGGSQGVVGKGFLDVDDAALSDLQVIWEQLPTSGNGHFSLRMLVADDHLFLTSGDRKEMEPAQGLDSNLGKVLRLTLDGTAAPCNPFEDEGGEVSPQIWSLGHRNPLGIDADSRGQLWVSEMGPQGGDELNLVQGGLNYGWPNASMGIHYDDTPIPDHQDGDGYEPPKAYWVPSISPGNLLIYQGDLFTGWKDNAIIGGLSGQNLTRVELDGQEATPADEWNMRARIRAVGEAPDGSIWILEDGTSGRLLELRPS